MGLERAFINSCLPMDERLIVKRATSGTSREIVTFCAAPPHHSMTRPPTLISRCRHDFVHSGLPARRPMSSSFSFVGKRCIYYIAYTRLHATVFLILGGRGLGTPHPRSRFVFLGTYCGSAFSIEDHYLCCSRYLLLRSLLVCFNSTFDTLPFSGYDIVG